MQEIEYKTNCELKKYSTFKIGGKAKCVWFPKSKEEFITLLKNLNNFEVIGAGSNILFSSSLINKNIILTSELTHYELNNNILTVDAGIKTPMIANFLFQNGLSGLEFLIGLPARIGGAVYQNASAQGQSIEDTFLSADVFDIKNKKIITLSKKEMAFEYRKSILNNKNYILLNAQFELQKLSDDEIKAKIQQNLNFRKNHQPMLTIPNIGSTFKNPENNSAGKLFDECGLKGSKIGGAQVWENHANFIINVSDATSFDVLQLMCNMKQEVLNKFDINLKPEIIFINGNNEEEIELWKFLQK